ARRAGLFLERGLVEVILSEAGSEVGSLPLVAHALVETWLRRKGNSLTLQGYREAGGVAGAISQTAEATFEHRFSRSEQEVTKGLFLRLVNPGEGTPDTRRILARSEIERHPDAEVMQRVVDSLTEARLLTVDDASVQIAHEALVRTWPRLSHWIEESRDDLRTRQRISHAAWEWEQAGEDPDLLYRGTPLTLALEWVGKHPDQLGALERRFLDASTQAKAMAEAQAAERARRTRRIRLCAIAGLAILAAGATAASVAAFLAFREAQHNEELALKATAEARDRFAGALGAVAKGLVEADPLLALYLAAEAVARTEMGPPTYDARAAMITARRSLSRGDPYLVGSPVAAGDALALAVSPDGSLVAAARRDGTIDLIDTATRRRLGPSLRGHVGGVEDLDFSPDGRRLASCGDDGTIRIWRIEAGVGAGEPQLVMLEDVIWGVRFGPDGRMLASAGEDGTVRLWDGVKALPLGGPLIDRVGDILSVAFSPDGRGLIAGNGEGVIYGWNLDTREMLFEPVTGAHTSDVWDLLFSPKGNRFATVSSDGTSVILEYPSGRILGQALPGIERIGGVVFTPDGSLLVGGAADGRLRLWDVERQRLVAATASGHVQGIIDAGLSEDGRLIATLGLDQMIRFWRFGTAHPLASERLVVGRNAKGLAVSLDGRRIAAGDEAGEILVWDLGEAVEAMRLSGHGQQVWALAFAPGNTLIASGDRAGEIRLWDLESGRLVRTIAAGSGAVWSLAFLGGDRLLSASDLAVQVWDVGTGRLEARYESPGGRVTRAALAPGAGLAAIAATDGVVRLIDLEAARIVREIKADDDVIWSVAVSPDGGLLATASSDEVVALWDLSTGVQIAALTGHAGGATDVAFLGDGATLAAVDRSGQLHLWDWRSGRRLAEAWRAHDGASWRIVAHPDGERLITAGDDGRVRTWDELRAERACEIGGPAFDSLRRNQYLGEGERSLACGPGR
ncbi:MAG TPA: WD40 repeat domain-containing protein, partial [Paracoccaceae bacterium]|nr:WD40 repeat domain-containing protein [Paracoccaceae bacterium]